MAVASPPAISHGLMLQIFEEYVDGFERAFQIVKGGTLKCDNVTMEFAAEWFNLHKPLIHLITAVDMPDLHFERIGYKAIGTVAVNKRKMLQYYSFAFTAYMRYCQTLKRTVNEHYLPEGQMAIEAEGEDVEGDGDQVVLVQANGSHQIDED